MSAKERSKTTLQQQVRKRQPFASDAQEAFLNLIRTAGVLEEEFQHLFREHGVSMSQYNALRIIAGAGRGGIRVREIAERMVVRDPDISRLVDRLEAAGLVGRRRCRQDRRVVWVSLQPAGRRLLRALEGPVMALHDRQLGHMGTTKLRQLSDLLVHARQVAEKAE